MICESGQRKNKGIVSIKTYLSAVKLLFNELLRCLELPRGTAIFLYVLHYFGVRSGMNGLLFIRVILS